MRSASGSKASRVCMGLLVDRTEFLANNNNRIAHTRGSCAARHIVDRQYVVECHEPKEIVCEMGIEFLQLREPQFLQLALLVERQSHGLPYQLMSNAEGYALADQIGGRGKRVHVAGFCCFLH